MERNRRPRKADDEVSLLGRRSLNTKVTASFHRLLDWHCDRVALRKARRPTTGELLEDRLRPILEEESTPPADYQGHKKKPTRSTKKRGPRVTKNFDQALALAKLHGPRPAA